MYQLSLQIITVRKEANLSVWRGFSAAVARLHCCYNVCHSIKRRHHECVPSHPPISGELQGVWGWVQLDSLFPCSCPVALINTHPHWHAAQHIKNTYFDMWCSSPSHCLCETHTLIHQCVHGCIRLILPTQVPDSSCVYRKLCLQKTNHTYELRDCGKKPVS